MEVKHFHVWKGYPVLMAIYNNSVSGRLRKACKRNAKRFEPFWNEIVDWLKEDAKEHKWDFKSFNEIPYQEKDFNDRFTDFLTEEVLDLQPYYFTEDLMEYADGITGRQETDISWLFVENTPEEDGEGVEEAE